jgi:hypothetical protein
MGESRARSGCEGSAVIDGGAELLSLERGWARGSRGFVVSVVCFGRIHESVTDTFSRTCRLNHENHETTLHDRTLLSQKQATAWA